MYRKSLSWLLAPALATLMAASAGSGQAAPPTASTAVRASSAAPQLALRALQQRARALAVSSGGTVAPEEAVRQLLDYAEQQFPALFPGRAATQNAAPFLYRHYPATGLYVGVAMSSGGGFTQGNIYLMGGSYGNAPVHVGRLLDYITPVGPGFEITPETDKVQLTQESFTTLRVQVQRLRGFEGPLQLTLQDLPAGVTANAVTLAAGASSASLTLTAQPGAAQSQPTIATLHVSAGALVAREPVTVTLRGAPGRVDTTFSGGPVLTPVGAGEDYAQAVAVQPDGKVIVAGSAATNTGTVVALVRYQRDGALDPSFGQGGKVLTPVGTRSDVAAAIALQPDGRIVVAGSTDQGEPGGLDFLLLRYRADGSLDPAFGQGGKVIVPVGAETDRALAVAIQDDGRIVAAGESQSGTSTTGQDFALVRVLADGTLDAGFGNGGKVVTAVRAGSARDIAYALVLPRIGNEQRIIAVGGGGDFVAVRYLANGALDASFGAGGKVQGLFGSSIGAARAAGLTADGRLLMVGGINDDFAAAQLTASGTLDSMFGNTTGKVVHPVSAGNWDNAQALVRLPTGKWLLAGWANSGNSSSGDFVAMRLMPGGGLDPTFAESGMVVLPVASGTRNDQARGVALQLDERISTVRAIVAGEASSGNHDFAVLRLWL